MQKLILERYLALHPKERQIVDLLSVNWAPLSLRPIKDALGLPQTEKLKLDWLIEQGMIVKQRPHGGSEGYACHPALMDLVIRHLAQCSELESVIRRVDIASPLENHSRGNPRSLKEELVFVSGQQFVREVRLGLYLGDLSYIDHVYASFIKYKGRYWSHSWHVTPMPYAICVEALLNPFDSHWFLAQKEEVRHRYLPGILLRLIDHFKFDAETFDSLSRTAVESKVVSPSLVVGALLMADPQKIEAHLACLDPQGFDAIALRAIQSLLMGAADYGIPLFEDALRKYRRTSGDKKGVLPGIFGVMHLLVFLLRREPKDLQRSKTLMGQAVDWQSMYPAYEVLRLAYYLENQQSPGSKQLEDALISECAKDQPDPWMMWFGLVLLIRINDRPSAAVALLDCCRKLKEDFAGKSLDWIAAEFELLAIRLSNHSEVQGPGISEGVRARTGWIFLTERVHFEAGWERTLRAIESKFHTKSQEPRDEAGAQSAESRLVWMLEILHLECRIEVREQKKTGKGWGKGRIISLRSLLHADHQLECMTEADRKIISHLYADPYYREIQLAEEGWRALSLHPHVQRASTALPVEVVVSLPELRITRLHGGRVRIKLWPNCLYDSPLVFSDESLDRIRVTTFRPEHHRLMEIIGQGFDAPESAHTRVIETLRAVSSLVTIHSELGTDDLTGVESVPPDSRPRLQLIPEGDGIRVTLQVRPFGSYGPFFHPGSGPRSIMTEAEGRKLKTDRDHDLERAQAEKVIQASSLLEGAMGDGEARVCVFETAEESLEFLLDVQKLDPESLEIEWPKGKKFEVIGEAGAQQFRMHVGKQRDWFAVSGELKLDQGEVLLMQTLLEISGDTSGRFVKLDGDRFLALTDSFRKRLDDIRGYTEAQGDHRRIHPLALSLLDDMASDFAEFETDEAFRSRIESLHISRDLQPKPPSTLTAELRDYQLDGYVWLSRLAAWGVGACLADDMGLGKTLQAIALILSRAADGPTLVVAPTSVLFNWHNEIGRFAPTLRPVALSGDRVELIKGLGPYDVLVVSYGLLQQDSVVELLSPVKFRTLVLDEAQAIKNARTRRSRSVMALDGEFRVVLTGTPLENHLGELWNLFRFINPGLLGSEDSFTRRFANPIERNRSRDARLRLKHLIQPFILRRTKTEVLRELPERTEIELKVILSPKEAAYYEALRKRLLDDLSAPAVGIADQRFRVLAAITKLRRACCNPSLVSPELDLPSSKLELLLGLLDELIDNRHKSLVFSQFTDHLELVQKVLDERGIAYQYLDGQTSQPERKRRVEAFQSGEGDVFLISLKAGGFGLNLTAADYVIHLDPWWNPAVEDQASSRAHRMGQERPVTVYRLITEGTIEEQIVALHKTKKELADSLLEGGELSGRMDAEDLLNLMREGLSSHEREADDR